ncbi:MAG: phage/plasmid primase, P4 family [Clostridia bacterium]|nr:phage/plasmid primase, P4 family [Clostridia bacterium]
MLDGKERNFLLKMLEETTKDNPMPLVNFSTLLACTEEEAKAVIDDIMKSTDLIVETPDGYYCRNEQDNIFDIANKNVLDRRIYEYIKNNFTDPVEAQLFIADLAEIATKQRKKTEFLNLTKGLVKTIAKADKKFKKQQELEERQQKIQGKYGTLPPFIKTVVKKDGSVILVVDCPMLAKYLRDHYNFKLVRNPQTEDTKFYLYENGVYRELSKDLLQGFIKQPIVEFDEGLVKSYDLREVERLLKTDIESCKSGDFNTNEDIIVFENGVLNIKTGELLDHDPKYLSTIKIPCNYNADKMGTPTPFEAWETAKQEAPVFCNYLMTLANEQGNKQGEDDKSITLLLEFMAVAISNIQGWRFKKALFLVGRGDTGKSKIFDLISGLIGGNNTAEASLSQLEEKFGKTALYEKRFVFDSDMSFFTINELKTFKNATGGDDIQIERKGKDPFNYKFRGLLAYGCNKLPQFGGDRGQWVYDRIIPFECKNVIPKDKQNKRLYEDMFAEREAIVKLLIPYLLKAVNNGYEFDIPDCCLALKEQYRVDNEPIRQFFEECCCMRGGDNPREIKDDKKDYTRREVFYAYKAWYCDNVRGGYYNGVSEKKFMNEMLEILSEGGFTKEEATFNTTTGRYYIITLTDTGKDYYAEYKGSK